MMALLKMNSEIDVVPNTNKKQSPADRWKKALASPSRPVVSPFRPIARHVNVIPPGLPTINPIVMRAPAANTRPRFDVNDKEQYKKQCEQMKKINKEKKAAENKKIQDEIDKFILSDLKHNVYGLKLLVVEALRFVLRRDAGITLKKTGRLEQYNGAIQATYALLEDLNILVSRFTSPGELTIFRNAYLRDNGIRLSDADAFLMQRQRIVSTLSMQGLFAPINPIAGNSFNKEKYPNVFWKKCPALANATQTSATTHQSGEYDRQVCQKQL
jgi:hypothetical protein